MIIIPIFACSVEEEMFVYNVCMCLCVCIYIYAQWKRRNLPYFLFFLLLLNLHVVFCSFWPGQCLLMLSHWTKTYQFLFTQLTHNLCCTSLDPPPPHLVTLVVFPLKNDRPTKKASTFLVYSMLCLKQILDSIFLAACFLSICTEQSFPEIYTNTNNYKTFANWK